MPSTASYLAVGGIAAVATFIFTPIVGWFARRVGWVVEPDARRVHKVTTPDVGGIAMFGGFAVAFVVSRLLGSFAPLFAANSEPYGIFLGALVMFLVGLVDDVRDISAPGQGGRHGRGGRDPRLLRRDDVHLARAVRRRDRAQ